MTTAIRESGSSKRGKAMSDDTSDGKCPLGDDCDLTVAYMAGMEKARDRIEALEAALAQGVDLIKGDAVGSEWKKGCASFLKRARAALKGDGDE